MMNLLVLELELNKNKNEINKICEEIIDYFNYKSDLEKSDIINMLYTITDILDMIEKLLTKYVEELEVYYNAK